MTIEENVPLAPYTTFHVGGPARYFANAMSTEDVVEAFDFAHAHELKVFVLGGGSNILVSDAGFAGLVLKINTQEFSIADGDRGTKIFTADAGVLWDAFVERTVEAGCIGAENLSLIPGTVGGAVVQNIGAYGCEVKGFVESVDVYDVQLKKVRTLTQAECAFGYRESIFKHEEGRLVVLHARFRLATDGVPNIGYKDISEYFREAGITDPRATDVRRAVIAVRRGKFSMLPSHGTAGSFFKNPIVSSALGEVILAKYPDAVYTRIDEVSVKLSAAWIIDHVLHMRGVCEGSVGCATSQALVVVNYGDATSAQIKNFVSTIQKKCFELTGVQLEREVIYVGT